MHPIRHLMFIYIDFCDFKGLLRGIDGPNFRLGEVFGQGDGDGATVSGLGTDHGASVSGPPGQKAEIVRGARSERVRAEMTLP